MWASRRKLAVEERLDGKKSGSVLQSGQATHIVRHEPLTYGPVSTSDLEVVAKHPPSRWQARCCGSQYGDMDISFLRFSGWTRGY